MININSFNHNIASSGVKSVASAKEGFSSVMSSADSQTSSASQKPRLGIKVGIDYILAKLEDHGYSTPDEKAYLHDTVKDREQIDNAVKKLKGSGSDAAYFASKMRHGVLLPNGIMADSTPPEEAERFSHLTRWEVEAIEHVEGSDMSIGEYGSFAGIVSYSKVQGIISGEMGLKDFVMLSSWFKESGQHSSRKHLDNQQMLNRLYEVLSSKEKNTSSTP